ncbi:MAG TPA: hypothetical protein VF996_02745, partial [Candidatus Saccharimonadales bacterium]
MKVNRRSSQENGDLSSVEQTKKISSRINLRGLISFGRSYGSVLHALVPGRMSDLKVLFSRYELRSYGSVLHALVPGRMSDGLAKLIGRMDRCSYGSVLHALVPGRMSVASLIMAVVAIIGLALPFNQTQPLNAAASDELNFQARLLNDAGGVVPDGFYHAEFKLYDSAAAGGSAQGVC